MEREMGTVLAKLANIQEELHDAKDARKLVYERIEATNTKVDHLGWRMDLLEATMNKQAPTIAEFLTYKEQVRGAGRLGRILWLLGGIILSGAVWVAGALHFGK